MTRPVATRRLTIKKEIKSSLAPAAIGPYSQAIESLGEKIFFISGQIPLKPDEVQIEYSDFISQAKQVFENLNQIVKAANCEMEDVVKLTIYLTDLTNFDALNQIMTNYFNEPFPARSTIEVSALPKGALVEIDAILVR